MFHIPAHKNVQNPAAQIRFHGVPLVYSIWELRGWSVKGISQYLRNWHFNETVG